MPSNKTCATSDCDSHLSISYCQTPGIYIRKRISRTIPRLYKPPNKRICLNCGVENQRGHKSNPGGACLGRGWLSSLITFHPRPAARKTNNTVGEKNRATNTRYSTNT